MIQIKKTILTLVALLALTTGAWAQNVLNIVVSGTSATIKYDGNASNNPYFGGDEWKQSEFPWDNEYSTRPTITTVTIDGSCKNFSGTSLRSLFIGFSGLTTINGLDNLNTANVQDMEYMFADCSSLTSLDLSSLNTARLTTMSNMFAYCSKLTTVDLSSWNTAKVWNTGYMFYNCSKLENIYVGDGWSTAKVTQSDDMFTGCTKLLSMNTANPATNKTNAHTGDGGYLKVKPAGDYLFTVAPCEHGSGTVKFFVDEKEVKGANEGDLVTMTVTPDEGYVVGSVSANAYTTWAGSRRNAPAAIPMLGNVTLTPVEGKANTWTFTMPAASVELKVGYLATSNLFLSKEALADKASIAVTAGETTVEFDDDGKSKTTVIEGSTVTTKYNGTKKILGMKVAKKVEAKTLAEATSEDIGKIAGKDGKIYATKADAEAVATGNAVAMIAYVGSDTGVEGYTRGLALALTDEASTMKWATATGASGAAAHTPAAPTPMTSSWMLPSKGQWEKMFAAFGGNSGSYTGLNTAIGNAGGTALVVVNDGSMYWTSTKNNVSTAYSAYLYHEQVGLGPQGMDNVYYVRACLAF